MGFLEAVVFASQMDFDKLTLLAQNDPVEFCAKRQNLIELALKQWGGICRPLQAQIDEMRLSNASPRKRLTALKDQLQEQLELLEVALDRYQQLLSGRLGSEQMRLGEISLDKLSELDALLAAIASLKVALQGAVGDQMHSVR